MPPTVRLLTLVAGLAVTSLLIAATGTSPAASQPAKSAPGVVVRDPAESQRLKLMQGVRSWGYQLRRIDLASVARSPFDLVVIDHYVATTRTAQSDQPAGQITDLKVKPDGTRRLVLGYMSIGEAETYRFYWQPEWQQPGRQPAWLGAENPQWPGNFNVRYWDPAWQRLIFGSPQSYLDRLIAAGFDGVYIDRADAFMEWGKTNPAAEGEMVRFLAALAAYARVRSPAFLVIMQNAEELLDYEAILAAIDGLGKEDLFYGINHDTMPNDADTVSSSIDMLRKLQQRGRPVLVVEYLEEITKIRDVRRRAAAERYISYFAPRDLGELWAVAPDEKAIPARP